MKIQAGITLQFIPLISQGFISGSDSQGESSSEHSVQEEGGDVPGGVLEVPGHAKDDLLVCRL